MQAEITLVERITQAYMARRGARMLCVLAVLCTSLLLLLLAGGFPPWAWRLLFQAVMQAPALVAAHGQIVFLALAGLLLLSVTILLAWWALLWVSWRMLTYWWYERQELRKFALDMAEAQGQVEEEEAYTDQYYQQSGQLTEYEEGEETEEFAYANQHNPLQRRRFYPLAPLSPEDQEEEPWLGDEEEEQEADLEPDEIAALALQEHWEDSGKDADLSRVQSLRPVRLIETTTYKPRIVEHPAAQVRTDELQHSSYGRFTPFTATATAQAPRFNTILYEPEAAPTAISQFKSKIQAPAPRQAAIQLVVGTGLDVGLKRKGKPNEDSLLALQNTRMLQESSYPVGLFVIADGMGGHGNGQEASRMVIQSLSKTIVPSIIYGPTDDNYAELLAEGVHHANLAVYQRNRVESSDMGTTIAAALVIDTTAYVANVGDSRVYLYRASSGLSQITRDHSTVARLVENGIIQPEDIYTHPRRNEIYRSLGHHPSEDIDRFTLALQPDDLLLLCSDGLWEMVRDAKIKQIIQETLPQASQVSTALIQAALEGGGQDNVSVIAVYIKPEYINKE
jgi:serine/threonine protein phosphatase PrpC